VCDGVAQAQLGQLGGDLVGARVARDRLAGERLEQRRCLRVDAQAQHVQRGAVPHRRQLDAVDELDAMVRGRAARFGQPGHGVVVGQREHADAGRGRGLEQRGRRERAVRGGAVAVEVGGHGADCGLGSLQGPARRCFSAPDGGRGLQRGRRTMRAPDPDPGRRCR
jgi:hypothetical protein